MGGVSKTYLVNLCDVLTAQLAEALREKELLAVENGLLHELLDEKIEGDIEFEEEVNTPTDMAVERESVYLHPAANAALNAVARALKEIQEAHPVRTGADLIVIQEIENLVDGLYVTIHLGGTFPSEELTDRIYDLLYT